jgi:transposase
LKSLSFTSKRKGRNLSRGQSNRHGETGAPGNHEATAFQGGMIIRKYIVTLTRDERKFLRSITRKGIHRSQTILNALILLDCDRGDFQTGRSTNGDIARVLNISMKKIDRVKKRFVEDGLDRALGRGRSRRIYQKKTNDDFEAHLVALTCSDPPEGCARWSLRLLADKAVELNYIDSISHESVRRILRKQTQTASATAL